MKKFKLLLVLSLCAIITLITNVNVSNAYDFTSDHITIENDVEATKQKLHPVLIVKNNTNTDLSVTYDFYIHENDPDEFSSKLWVKANESIILELPQLHHLGDTKESRTIWFSWDESTRRKPLQNQIETSIFSNPVTPPKTELGLN